MGGGWTGIRDLAETAGDLAGNYFLPGSSLLTDQLVSKGSQKQLSSPLGEIGQIASGFAGSEGLGPLPQSAGGALEQSALSSIGNSVSGLFGSSGIAPGAATDAGAIATSPVAGGAPGTAPLAGTGGATVGGAGAGAGAISAPAGVGAAVPDLTQAADAASSVGNNAALSAGSSAAAAPASGAPSSGGIGGFLKSVFGGGTQSGQSDASFTNFLNQNATAPTSTASLAGEAPGAALSPALQGADAAAQVPTAGIGGAAPAGAASTAGNTGIQLLKSLGGAAGVGSSTTPVGSAFGNFLGANANLAVPAGILGYEAIESGKQPAGFDQLEQEAAQGMTQGQQLEGYLKSGTLPGGLQGAVQQNLAATQANIRSRYASMGMSGSSAEQQDLANASTQSQAQSSQLAQQLLSTGINETGQSAGIYQSLLNDIDKSDAGLTSALAAFAGAAAGGGGGGQTFKISPST